jgi:hypothetical protein
MRPDEVRAGGDIAPGGLSAAFQFRRFAAPAAPRRGDHRRSTTFVRRSPMYSGRGFHPSISIHMSDAPESRSFAPAATQHAVLRLAVFHRSEDVQEHIAPLQSRD